MPRMSEDAYIEIDGMKLSHILKKRGLAASKVSEDLGYSIKYIQQSMDSGKLRKGVAKMLSVMYGIDSDEYKVTEKYVPAVVEEKSNNLDWFTPEMLNKIIYSAVYHAMVEALNGDKAD